MSTGLWNNYVLHASICVSPKEVVVLHVVYQYIYGNLKIVLKYIIKSRFCFTARKIAIVRVRYSAFTCLTRFTKFEVCYLYTMLYNLKTECFIISMICQKILNCGVYFTICPLKQSVPTEPEALLASRGNPATGGGGILSG